MILNPQETEANTQGHIRRLEPSDRPFIETSSQEAYGVTVRFYEHSGYHLAARIKNSYRAGDDKLIFQKDLI